jgi:hypothetical protein
LAQAMAQGKFQEALADKSFGSAMMLRR